MKNCLITALSFFYFLFIFPPAIVAQTLCTDGAGLNQRAAADFTLAVISDTHTGGPESSYTPGNFAKVTRWIADHKSELNIQFVFHTGDVTAGDRIMVPPLPPLSDQWLEASTAMKNLEWNIPYSITVGNRDDVLFFDQYFGLIHFSDQPWYGGGFPAGANTSSYYLFSASGYDFIIFSGNNVTEAQKIFQAYPYRNGIYVPHIYVNLDGTVSSTIIQNMIKSQDNVFMTLNGHTHCYPTASYVCRNTITNNFGHPVYQITHPSSPIIRLYLFRPEKQVICAYTYNPIENTFYTVSNSQFSLNWNLRSAAHKPGDANEDGIVNGADFSIWLNNYSKIIPTPVTNSHRNGDFNSDGVVNGADFSIWLNNYGR